MDNINTNFLEKSIATLEKSYSCLIASKADSIEYEMYRNSFVKGFEMTLEQSGKLLKKKITPYFASNKAVDALTFKDIFRHASKYGLLNEAEVLRWFKYRDNRNSTAHDYGQEFAEATLVLALDFMQDAKRLKDIINNG